MKRFVEIAWNAPIDPKLFNHLRNDFRFNETQLNVFDSVTKHSGNLDFHADNTSLDKKKFGRVYNQVAECVLTELIRLAAIGYRHEINQKLKQNP